jgi:hypothetical protein
MSQHTAADPDLDRPNSYLAPDRPPPLRRRVHRDPESAALRLERSLVEGWVRKLPEAELLAFLAKLDPDRPLAALVRLTPVEAGLVVCLARVAIHAAVAAVHAGESGE